MARSHTTKRAHGRTTRVHWQTLLSLLLAAVFLYVVVPRFKTFHQSFQSLHYARLGWLIAALLAALATYAAAAGIYRLLAKYPIRYVQTVIVEMAGTFVNRILPGGVGALSINFEYLRRHKHTAAEAGSVIAVNNLLGFLGNMLLVAGALVLVPTHFRGISLPHATFYWVLAVAITVVVAVLVWSRKLRSELYRTLLDVQRNIIKYRAHPVRLISALGVSMVLTLLYTWCLAACAQALGIHLAVAEVLVIMTIGVAAGTLTPTPGGLFGAEAGLFAGFIAYGVPHTVALAIVLMYRLLTYWLPLLLGALALFLTERLGYL